MKKIFLSILLLMINFPSFAQSETNENSLLWKISGKNFKSPSYLFGTIHIICQDNYLWTDVMNDAFTKTQALYLELPMADKGFQQKMMEHIMLKDGKQLKDFFTAKQYQKLDLFFKDSMKMPLAMFSKMKPFGIMSFAILKYIDCNGKMPISYEEKLMGQAIERNLKVSGLETIEDQMKIFDDLPKDSIAKMVMASVTDTQKNKNIFQTMMNAYLAQDLDVLYNEIVRSPEYEAHLTALLYERNLKWIPLIMTAAKEKPTFFAVGAGHLPGEKGVLALLRKQGYKVEPVK